MNRLIMTEESSKERAVTMYFSPVDEKFLGDVDIEPHGFSFCRKEGLICIGRIMNDPYCIPCDTYEQALNIQKHCAHAFGRNIDIPYYYSS